MSKAEEKLVLDNFKMLTDIIAQQTTTLNALTKLSEALIEKVTKLEISEAIRQTLKAQANE